MISLVAQKQVSADRPMTRALRRLGHHANHKRVLRLMREDILLALQRKTFVSTTVSNHDHAVYTNLVPGLSVRDVNQLWVSGITFIRPANGSIWP